MNLKQVYQDFEELAEQLNIRLISGKGNFDGDYCMVEQDKYIVVNKNRPIKFRLKRLASAFSLVDLSKIYVKPAIREMIDVEKKGSLF